MGLHSVATTWSWIGFTILVLVLIGLDLAVVNRKAKQMTVKVALAWTAVWVSLALVFNLCVYFWYGTDRALEFFTGYLVEEALSVDNLFVFLVIFSYFAVAPNLQRRVLVWGILGAQIMRSLFIIPGTALVQQFHWITYVFGGFLVITGIKLLVSDNEEIDPERNRALRLFRKLIPVTKDFRGSRFFVRESGKLFATPLLMVLICIEASDVLFAVDSIPAILSITQDPFIAYTSNIFAILGLRSLYFALAGMMGKFRFLNVGLALVLTFVGVKMLIAQWYKIPIAVSLGVVALILAASVTISMLRPEAPPPPLPVDHPGPLADGQDAEKSDDDEVAEPT